ncbi:MAG TPA: helix-turn-helix domain-containing protein [Solirubrobacteraceae bacterium]|nr:helix-turn-helix domain-containing protein [Solirubrobacteraceae bacterium]
MSVQTGSGKFFCQTQCSESEFLVESNKDTVSAPLWRELDPALGEILRPTLPALADEVIDAVRQSVPAYADPLRGSYGRNMRVGVEQALRGFLELIESGEGDSRLPEREVYVRLGAGELREGRSLEALLAAYRVGARAAWRGLAATAQSAGVAPASIYRLAEAIFAYIDELSGASAEGYAREQSNRAGELESRRRLVLELLLADPPASEAAVTEAARAIDWRVPASCAALLIDDGATRVLRRLPMGTLHAAQGDRQLALIGDPDAPGLLGTLRRAVGSGHAALGPVVEPRDVARSLRWAALALELPGTAGTREGLVVAGDRLLDLIVFRDRELLEELARRRLSPLAGLTPSARTRLRRTLLVWLEHQGDVGQTAAALSVHAQTVRYRLGQLRELFGPALAESDRRLELQLALRSAASAD